MTRAYYKISGLAFCLLFLFGAGNAEAASLKVSPDTGVYSTGSTFTVRVVIDTKGKPVNAAEGALSFNPRELSVVSVSRATSIFNLWTLEPTFSNGAGTISFGGGSPTGYTGSAGTIMTVTFKTQGAGTPKLSFTSGSVLAADGLGTNVLAGMTGGTYSVNATAATPQAEPVYVPPANTPRAPSITSSTHPESDGWYAKNDAALSWTLPSGITAVRTLLDSNPGTIPTKVYDTPIANITLEDLNEGVSYFHVQLKNSDGWGGVAHYRLGVDTEKPTSFTISEPEGQDPANPERALLFAVEDRSPVTRYLVQLDGGEATEFKDAEETGRFALPTLPPGRHSVIVEAFDSAGNSLISTYSFDIASFEKPVFTEYPERMSAGVVPVLRGSTRPNATVTISKTGADGEVVEQTVTSDADGSFTYIPDEAFSRGVFDIVAVATDAYGAMSAPSDTIRIVVEEPGYIRIGGMVMSVLSVVIPILALLLLLVFGLWYLTHRLHLWRRRILKETGEAEAALAKEFDSLTKVLAARVTELTDARRGKLTRAEEHLVGEVETWIGVARKRIAKEIGDIDDVVE